MQQKPKFISNFYDSEESAKNWGLLRKLYKIAKTDNYHHFRYYFSSHVSLTKRVDLIRTEWFHSVVGIRWNEGLKGYEADSWGTEFIFMLPQNSRTSNRAAFHIFGMDKEKNITVNIEYNILRNGSDQSKIEKKKDEVVFRKSHEYNFHEMIVNGAVNGMHMLGDYRIHVTSLDKISIIAYVFHTKSAADYFLVHPVGMGGDYYAFSLPGRSTMTLYFLPLEAANKTISQSHDVHNVSITLKQKNKLETIKQSMEAGSLWQYTAPVEQTISVWIRDQLSNSNATRVKKLKARTMSNVELARLIIIASVRDISIAEGKKTDFGCFMPTPMIVDRCAELTNPVYYPATEDFANNVLLTAPSHQCPQDTIDIRSSMKTEPKSLSVIWDEAAEQISLKGKASSKTFAIISRTTIMNIVHRGNNKGSFIHEVPAYSQWVNGDSAVIVPKDSQGTLYVLADDYGREATMEGFEYPVFDAVEDVSPDFSLFLYTRQLTAGVYRVGIDQELGGRYIAILIAEMESGYSIGYVAAINRMFHTYTHLTA
uniref:Calpain_III domain-containing protein n=1 Tax=Elaeophora elaphi TaxID=1147741 RepID=A0A0R3RSH4_9BILA